MGRSGLPAFTALGRGLGLWREELLAYFEEPTTNGYAEGVINKIKVINRRPTACRASTASVDGSS